MTVRLRLARATVTREDMTVLSNATLTVSAGEIVGVVGANGAGKTTMLRAAVGLAQLVGGTVELSGADVRRLSDARRATLAAYLPQERRVGWNMSAWRIAALGALDAPPAQSRMRAYAALARVGLAGLEERGVLEMSGGERARVLLARLLTSDAPLLVADEPAAGLDPDAQLLALELFRDEAHRGAAVVITLHDLNLAVRFCDRLVVLAGGAVIADAPPVEALSPGVLATAFRLNGALQAGPHGFMLAADRMEDGA